MNSLNFSTQKYKYKGSFPSNGNSNAPHINKHQVYYI